MLMYILPEKSWEVKVHKELGLRASTNVST